MISVIVLSSDGYSDCWEPLFMSFKKFFPNIENYELVLSTNTKTYTYPGLDIKCITHGLEAAWSKRLKNTLDQIENDVVLVLVEDFFLRSKIDKKVFEEIVQLMKIEDIDHVRLINYKSKYKTNTSRFFLLDEICKKTNHRFLYLPGLWKKEVLKKYIVDFEMPYMAEKMGNLRSKILKDNFYCLSKEYTRQNGQFYHSSSSGAIYKGKWKEWVNDFIIKHGIEIDLNKRGIGTSEYNRKIRNKTLIGVMKDPKSTLKSILSVLMLFFKSK